MLDIRQLFEDVIVDLEFGKSLDEALSGQDSAKLRRLMKKNVIKFHYKKKDGTERTANGTLKKELLPKFKTERRAAYNPLRFVYWDTDRHQFRSFLRANFISYDKPEKEKSVESNPKENKTN